MMIGVTDSGIGGLNLLARLIKKKCANRYVYLADNANIPYGNKTRRQLCDIAFNNVKRLVEYGANVIIFGCNTLSVCALDAVRKKVSLPLFGLIPRPELTFGRSLILTTPSTGLFLPSLPKGASLITPDKLAYLIDRDYPRMQSVASYLSPLLSPYSDIDSVYLGCSHYLYAESVIRAMIPRAKIIEGTEALSSLIKSILPPMTLKDQRADFLFTGKEEQARYYDILSSLLQ